MCYSLAAVDRAFGSAMQPAARREQLKLGGICEVAQAGYLTDVDIAQLRQARRSLADPEWVVTVRYFARVGQQLAQRFLHLGSAAADAE